MQMDLNCLCACVLKVECSDQRHSNKERREGDACYFPVYINSIH